MWCSNATFVLTFTAWRNDFSKVHKTIAETAMILSTPLKLPFLIAPLMKKARFNACNTTGGTVSNHDDDHRHDEKCVRKIKHMAFRQDTSFYLNWISVKHNFQFRISVNSRRELSN